MLNGFRILDADCHVLEPDAMWRERLPEAMRPRAPRWVEVDDEEPLGERVERYGVRGLTPSRHRFEVDALPVLHRCSPTVQAEASRLTAARFASDLEGDGIPPAAQLQALDRMGVDLAFLYPTVALQLLGIDDLDPVMTVALARVYNDWLREFASHAPDRLFAVGVISRHDASGMLTELVRVADFGFRAVVLRPNVTRGRRLSDPAHEPFWAECARRGIAVGLHEGAHARVPAAGADRFFTRFALHACSHPLEQMMAFLDLLEGGVLERHPGLRVAFLEAGAGWLPYWLWRLDHVAYGNLAWEVRDNVRQPPSHYFRRQCYVSIEPAEPDLGEVVRAVGADRLLFGSDYPHMDHDADVVGKAVALARTLGAEVTTSILWDNPRRFYGLDP